MGITKESISIHRLTGKISELRNHEEIISILKNRKYNIIREDPLEICFALPKSAYSGWNKNKIIEGSILYHPVSGDFEFLYPDKYSLPDLLVPAIASILFACYSGWFGFVIIVLVVAGVSRFSFLFYKNVLGREFISDLKLKADYP